MGTGACSGIGLSPMEAEVSGVPATLHEASSKDTQPYRPPPRPVGGLAPFTSVNTCNKAKQTNDSFKGSKNGRSMDSPVPAPGT